MKLFDVAPVRQRLGRWLRILRRILLWCLGLLVLLGAIVWLGKPEIGSKKNLPLVTGSLDLAWADGQVETIIDDEGYSSWVALDDVPVGLALAVVGVEDFRYFRHPGLDINQIYYAIIENIRNLGFTYGASTITQQLVKNVWLANTRSFTRKLAEAIMALELEGKLSKQEILEWYLNMCEMAPGIYGIRAGSRFYFGLEPHELRYGQQVFLAAVIHAPAWYAGHPERAIPRIRQLAVNLVEQKRITPSQASALSNVPFEFAKMRPKPNDTGLRKALLRLWPASSRTGKNLVLQSRLDGAVQAELEQLMHDLRADGGDVFVVDGGGRSLVLASRDGAERMRSIDPELRTLSFKDGLQALPSVIISRIRTNSIAFSTNHVFRMPVDWSLLPGYKHRL
ncbi:MAG TPA: biosynthetic peptidoglycan transglycosylase [Spirochaetota bacterium]|nr:biosynthetic peptidoglycan transglycosylase [Spirochaetota bacterium]